MRTGPWSCAACTSICGAVSSCRRCSRMPASTARCTRNWTPGSRKSRHRPTDPTPTAASWRERTASSSCWNPSIPGCSRKTICRICMRCGSRAWTLQTTIPASTLPLPPSIPNSSPTPARSRPLRAWTPPPTRRTRSPWRWPSCLRKRAIPPRPSTAQIRSSTTGAASTRTSATVPTITTTIWGWTTICWIPS